MCFWIILGLQGSVLLLAFNIHGIDPIIIVAVLSIAAIVALALPISIGGIGIRDAVIGLLLVGITSMTSSEFSLNMSIIQTMLNMIIPAIIGGLLIFIMTKKNKTLTDAIATSKA